MFSNYRLVKPIIKGLLTYIPGYLYLLNKKRSKRINSCSVPSFCFSLWNSLLLVLENKDRSIVSEIGPAGSLGLGICAILTGTKEYHVIDIESNYLLDRNLCLFDKIVDMFRNNVKCKSWDSINLPYNQNYLEIYKTKISDDVFVEMVRNDLIKCITNQKTQFFFIDKWESAKKNYYDIVFSRAVMEHVNEPFIIYKNIAFLLKDTGYMVHDIELHSHDLTKAVDGHLFIKDLIWKMIVGRREYLLNRLTSSEHFELIQSNFELVNFSVNKKEGQEFGCYVIAKKKEGL